MKTKWKHCGGCELGGKNKPILLRFSFGFLEFGLCWWFLRILADSFYNRCYGAPVQACSLAPSKLQTRSTGIIPTPRKHSGWMEWASLYPACSSLFNFVGERKRNTLNTIMHLEYFCLSPSHSMRFPVTAIIKSASFFEIIYMESQLNWVYFYRSTMFLGFASCNFLRAWILWTVSGGGPAGDKETLRRNRKKRRWGDLLLEWR